MTEFEIKRRTPRDRLETQVRLAFELAWKHHAETRSLLKADREQAVCDANINALRLLNGFVDTAVAQFFLDIHQN